MPIMAAMSFGCPSIAIITMSGWCLRRPLRLESLVGIRIIGCGRAIRAISAYFVSMPIGTTARRIIRRKMSLIIPNMWLRFRLTDIKKVFSA